MEAPDLAPLPDPETARAEMGETPALVRAFDPAAARPVAEAVRRRGRLLVLGEGSSRLFPGGRAVSEARRRALPFEVAAEGGRQAAEWPLERWAVLALSRSGKTREVEDLVRRLRAGRHDAVFEAGRCEERALAATKSVVLEALFVESVLEHLAPAGQAVETPPDRTGPAPAALPDPPARLTPHPAGTRLAGSRGLSGACGSTAATPPPGVRSGAGLGERLPALADAIAAVLEAEPPRAALDALARASHVHFAGRSDGVAAELALKSIEIARKRADLFEGTAFLHGLKHALDATDTLVLVDPFESEWPRFRDLAREIGMPVLAIAARETPFPTFVVPSVPGLDAYVQLAAGWSTLVRLS